VPDGERDEVVAEALLTLCASVRGAHGRGVKAVNVRYYALTALATCRTRRHRPLCLLADACPDPEAALAAANPSPLEELEGREAVAALLARLPNERLRLVVLLRAQGWTNAQIAARLGRSRSRVEQLLQEARRLVCQGPGAARR